MRHVLRSTVFGGIALSVVAAGAVYLSAFPSAARADPEPEPEIDPVELYISAETLNTKEASALAVFLQSSGWGVAMKGHEWTFTGTAMPIGAYTPNPIVESSEHVLEDGIYWVGVAGHLMNGEETYWFDANQFFIVGSAWGEQKRTASITCRDGYYACCTYQPTGLRDPVARCYQDGTAPPDGCVTGGEGTVSCSLGGTQGMGGPCAIECDDGYYACCKVVNNRPSCECIAITPGGTNECNGVNGTGNAECSKDLPVSYYQGDELNPDQDTN